MSGLNMVSLKVGESRQVAGERLIEGRHDAGLALIEHLRPGQEFRLSSEDATLYAFAMDSDGMEVLSNTGRHWLPGYTWACMPGPVSIRGGNRFIVVRYDWRGLASFGGPVESHGRLKYIDGCTDTVLCGPPRLGDPVLNLLHFPPGIRQTMHTHPSLRAGCVVRGRGRAICPIPEGEAIPDNAGFVDIDGKCFVSLPLEPGMVWFLPTGGQHCFHTDDEPMDVIAWHPDSDSGPSDEDHPMLNKTMVGTQSAKFLDAIRTR